MLWQWQPPALHRSMVECTFGADGETAAPNVQLSLEGTDRPLPDQRVDNEEWVMQLWELFEDRSFWIMRGYV